MKTEKTYEKSLLECLKKLIRYDENAIVEIDGYPTFSFGSCAPFVSDLNPLYFKYLRGSWLSFDCTGWSITDTGLRFLADTLKVNLIYHTDCIDKIVKCYEYITGKITKEIDRILDQARNNKKRRLFNNDCSKCPVMCSSYNPGDGDWDCECGVFGYDDPPDWACAATNNGCNLSRKTREKLTELESQLYGCEYYGYDVFLMVEEFEKHFKVDIITGNPKEED